MSVVVKWTSYNASQKRPTQYNNCQLYGHGNRNCHLLPRCLMCAGQHIKINCPSIKESNFVPKCSLCGDNHVSNDPNCPNKAVYLAICKSTSQRHRLQNVSATANNIHSINSPIALQHRHLPLPLQTNPKPSTSQATTSTNTTSNKTSYASVLIAQPVAQNHKELISAEEFVKLTMKLIHNLSNCKTRSEQFQVVSNLAFKFVYPHHGP